MPCSDIKAESLKDDHTQISLNTEDSHSHNIDDGCSPFCFCSCCQITVTAFKMEPFLDVPLQVKAYFSKKILFIETILPIRFTTIFGNLPKFNF